MVTLAAPLQAQCRDAWGALKPRMGARSSSMRLANCLLALQSKLLRFVECGELQRVGDNERVKVDVRILAATHRPLAQLAQSGTFRSDLYYRLAVFLIRTPSLIEHKQDMPIARRSLSGEARESSFQ